MGMADFYISISANDVILDKINNKLNNKLIQYKEYNVFNFIYKNHKIIVECFFDNLIIIVKLLYKACLMEQEDMHQIELETGINYNVKFNFDSELELLNWLYEIYDSKLDDYFKNLGFISVPAKYYYRNRNRLKKLYKILKEQ